MGGGGQKVSKIAWRHLWTTPNVIEVITNNRFSIQVYNKRLSFLLFRRTDRIATQFAKWRENCWTLIRIFRVSYFLSFQLINQFNLIPFNQTRHFVFFVKSLSREKSKLVLRFSFYHYQTNRKLQKRFFLSIYWSLYQSLSALLSNIDHFLWVSDVNF